MVKVAFITGITGQDGSYLCELLIEKGYDVWGLIRRASSINTERINHLYGDPKLTLRYGDLTDGPNLYNVIVDIKNKYLDNLEVLEVYNLAAMSHVKVSFDMPEYSGNVDALGTLRILEEYPKLWYSRKVSFLSHLHLNYLVKFKKCHKKKLLLFTQDHLMV